MTYTEFKNVGGRVVPSVMEMHPEDKPGERTTIRYLELDFDIEIDPSFFSLQNLKSRR
jgi:hypothetical protein